MLHPDMIAKAVNPMLHDDVKGTVLAMEIVNEEQYLEPDILKIIHDIKGNILYTSRSPIPYVEKFDPSINAKRIFGIFGFLWSFLKTFTLLEESPLERVESCDSNRLYDNGFTQRAVPYPYVKSFSVDSPKDIEKVEHHMLNDPLWKLYSK